MTRAIKEFIFNSVKRNVKDEINLLIIDTARRREDADEEDVELNSFIIECYTRFYDEVSKMEFSAQQNDAQ